MVYKFKANRVWRAYIGGRHIDGFYGKKSPIDCSMPEEWLASTVEAFNPDEPEKKENEGLSICEDGRLFRDVLSENPEKILGKKLNEKNGGKQSILVKLLDSAERLVIQCHPTVSFAKKYFGSPFGKTECWYMLDCDDDACIYLGFKPGITKEKWIELFKNQDVDGMLECLNKFNVKKGDFWFVSGGIPHAIGKGCFMIELQEPSDLMVIPERITPSGTVLSDKKLHCGLGFEKMFDCFEYDGLSAEETKNKYYRKVESSDNRFIPIVDKTLTDKFSMKTLKVNGNAEVDLGEKYAVVIVTDGNGNIKTYDYCSDLKKSDNFFVTAGSGNLSFSGNMTLVFCMPESNR